jgi:hypothetical protein
MDIGFGVRETAAMGRRANLAIVSSLLATPCFGSGGENDIGNIPFTGADAVANGRFSLELRPRYNRIDESDKPLRTDGGTARVVAGWRSAPFHGIRFALEAIHAGHFGPKHFNDDGTANAASPYPLLPDPRYTGVNQAYVDYTGIEAVRVRAGRQVVRLDNQRWVSDNDFRQTPQVFDGLGAAYTGIANTELLARYFWQVRTTSGVVNDLRLTLLHAAWNPARGHALGAYAVLHDQPLNGARTGFTNSSYRVAGVRAEGAAARFGAVDIAYIAEYAQQRPYAGGDARVKGAYWRAGAGLAAPDWTLRYDHEVKESNAGLYGVQMPLTDFYAFNGWSLHFYNTPRQGLRDQWLTARYALGDFTLYAEGHRFRSDYGNIDFGREVDIGVTYAGGENWTIRLQHAKYDPGAVTPDPDVRKTWLTLTYTH